MHFCMNKFKVYTYPFTQLAIETQSLYRVEPLIRHICSGLLLCQVEGSGSQTLLQ